MFTSGTQFDITEEGLEGLEDLRQSDLSALSPQTKIEYLILTNLDMDGLLDYEGVLTSVPRRYSSSDILEVLNCLKRKGWITIEGESGQKEFSTKELEAVKSREKEGYYGPPAGSPGSGYKTYTVKVYADGKRVDTREVSARSAEEAKDRVSRNPIPGRTMDYEVVLGDYPG